MQRLERSVSAASGPWRVREMAGEQALPDVEAAALPRVTHQSVRQVVAQAASVQDWPARQLSVLRNTYPAWDIDRERDPSGQVWWTACLRRRLTAELVTAGVVPERCASPAPNCVPPV